MLCSRLAPVLLVSALMAAACSSKATPGESMARADKYFADQKFAEAIVEYRRAISIDPKLGEARFRLAQSYEKTKDLRKAFPEYMRAADLLPDRTDVQLKAGQVLLAAGRFEDAKTRAVAVLDKESSNVDAQILKGNATAGLKELDTAVGDIEEAIKMAPENDKGYSQLGMMKMAKGQSAEAETAFKRAVEVQPKSINAQLSLAGFYWAAGRPQEAEAPLLEALHLDPKNAGAQRALAAFYRAFGRAAEAEAPLKAVAEIANDAPSRLALADYYIAVKRTPDALTILHAVAAEKEGFVDATLRLAALDYPQGKTAEAHKQVDGVLAQNPKNVSALLMKARFFMAENKMNEALTRVQTAVAEDTRSAGGQYLLGTILATTGDADGATAAFSEVLKINPRATAAQMQLAQLNMAKGSSKAAVEYAEQAAKNAGANPATKQMLARTLASNGQFDRASSELKELLKTYPNQSTLHSDVAKIALARNDRQTARKEFERARELDPTAIDAISGLVVLEIADKNVTRARALLDAQLQKAPNNTSLLLLSSAVSGVAGNKPEQEATLRKVLGVDPNNLAAYDALATLLIRSGRLQEAKNEYESVWKKQPKSTAAPTMIGLLLEAENKPAEAQKIYEKVVGAAPEAAVAANNLAWLYAEGGGNLDVALQLAQSASQRLPRVPQVSDTLGWVYLKKDLLPMAVNAFENSVRDDPNNPLYQYHLGLAHLKGGKVVKAKEAFEAALKKKPDYKDAQDALKKLQGR